MAQATSCRDEQGSARLALEGPMLMSCLRNTCQSLGLCHLEVKLLYAEPRPQRSSLPTYPFARERYWLPAMTGETACPPVPTVSAWDRRGKVGGEPQTDGGSTTMPTTLHPLVQCNISDFFAQRFSSTFD